VIKIIDIKKIKMSDLPQDEQVYLNSLGDGPTETPVYYNNGVDIFFVFDFILRDVKEFEKTSLDSLYRGGGLLKLTTKQGQVVIYDERYKWLRLVGGVARYHEGDNLIKTSIREGAIEELVILADDEQTRLVPKDMGHFVKPDIDSWNINVPDVREAGSISVVGCFLNNKNRSFEVVVEWDISDEKNLKILHSEDWFKGGRSGFVPFVIDIEGHVVGLYDGRHGYVGLPIESFHPTLSLPLQ